MKKILLFFIALTITSFVLITSCKKERKDDPIPSDPTKTAIVLSGNVIDVNQSPMSGVTVKVGGIQVITEFDGSFYFKSVTVPKERFIVEFSKTGYFSLSRSAVPTIGVPVDMEVGLISETDFNYAGSKSFSSTTTDSLEMISGCVVSFLPNSFVTEAGAPYSGTVNVKAAYLDPTMTNFPMFIFGGDLYGKDNAGNDVMLNPFTGLNVIITDPSGNKLQLDEANTKKATVKMQIPNTLLAAAPISIDLLEYNPIMGVSQSSGTANKTGGKYMGQVGHFSFWSCQEASSGIATITGRVTNSDTLPVPGVNVRVGHTMAKTDINGYYSAKVPTGVSMIIGIFPTYYGTFISPNTCAALSNNGTYTADFIVPALKKVYGRLVNCSGAPVSGKVSIDWYSFTAYTNVHASCFTQTDGTFELFIESSASTANLHAWGNNTDSIYYIYPSTSPYNVFDISLCPPIATGINQLTLTGAPFTNPYTVNTFDTKNGYKVTSANHTYIDIFGPMGSIYIGINGTSVGTYAIGAKSVTNMSLYFSNPITFNDTLQSGSIIITKYSQVGGLIEGTYTGTTGTGVQITNGKFSVIRTADQAK